MPKFFGSSGGTKDHGALEGLLDDDHIRYLYTDQSGPSGRSGGQYLVGGSGSEDDLRLRSTSHATKGQVFVEDFLICGSVNSGYGFVPTNAGDLYVAGHGEFEQTVRFDGNIAFKTTITSDSLIRADFSDATIFTLLDAQPHFQRSTGGNPSFVNVFQLYCFDETGGTVVVGSANAVQGRVAWERQAVPAATTTWTQNGVLIDRLGLAESATPNANVHILSRGLFVDPLTGASVGSQPSHHQVIGIEVNHFDSSAWPTDTNMIGYRTNSSMLFTGANSKARFSDDVSVFFGTDEDVSIKYEPGGAQQEWLFDVHAITLDRIVFNDSRATINFIIRSAPDTNQLVIVGTSGNVGIRDATPDTTLDVNGGISFGVTIVTDSLTLDGRNCFVLGNSSAATITLTLPSPNTQAGQMIHVKKYVAANTVEVIPPANSTIEGAAQARLTAQYASRTLWAGNATTWMILAST